MTERLSDLADRAAQLEEDERASAVRLRKDTIKRTGRCAFCDEPLANPAAYVCDASCREEVERQTRAALRNGRPSFLPKVG